MAVLQADLAEVAVLFVLPLLPMVHRLVQLLL